MSGWSFDPCPQMVVITPTQKTALYFFPSYSETAFPNYIICVCLAIKVGRHHFAALPIAKCAIDALYFAGLQKNVHCWIRHLYNDAQTLWGCCWELFCPRAKNQTVSSEGPSWLCLGNVFKCKPHDCDIFSQDSSSFGNFILLSRSSGWQIHPS